MSFRVSELGRGEVHARERLDAPSVQLPKQHSLGKRLKEILP